VLIGLRPISPRARSICPGGRAPRTPTPPVAAGGPDCCWWSGFRLAGDLPDNYTGRCPRWFLCWGIVAASHAHQPRLISPGPAVFTRGAEPPGPPRRRLLVVVRLPVVQPAGGLVAGGGPVAGGPALLVVWLPVVQRCWWSGCWWSSAAGGGPVAGGPALLVVWLLGVVRFAVGHACRSGRAGGQVGWEPVRWVAGGASEGVTSPMGQAGMPWVVSRARAVETDSGAMMAAMPTPMLKTRSISAGGI